MENVRRKMQFKPLESYKVVKKTRIRKAQKENM